MAGMSEPNESPAECTKDWHVFAPMEPGSKCRCGQREAGKDFTSKRVTTPAIEPVNWEAVRMLAISVGVREAARKCGISENTAMTRCRREGWLNDPMAREMNEKMRREKVSEAISSRTQFERKPVDSLLLSMRDDAIQGRAAALLATRKALVHMANRDPEELCLPEQADVLGKHVRSASIAGGYGAAQRVDTVAEAFGARSAEPMVIDAELLIGCPPSKTRSLLLTRS